MSIYDTLNEQQREAVYCTDGPLLILAGAGSGKTRVLTHRIAYLIEEKGVNPWNILAITFTNKAAGEMRERVDNLVGFGSESIWVSTFHSTCVRILRRHIDRLGYDTNFTIYDTDDQKTLMKDVCKLVEIDTKVYKERNLLAAISSAKNEMISAQEYALNAQGDFGKEKIAKVYQEYEKQMHANNALDFDDLLVKTVQLFETQPDVLENYQERFRYIMVDEYQDTNTVQFQLVSLLAGKYRDLCVVGDDDQSIYRFRGAKPEIMLGFERDYPGAGRILLDVNYRSTEEIVAPALRLIGENQKRFSKAIHTTGRHGKNVITKLWQDPGEENLAIAREIQLYLQSGVRPGDIAVLYRTNAGPRFLMEKLMEYNLPFRTRDTVPNLYEHWISRNILTYIRIAMGSRAREDILQVINRPKRYISREAMPDETVSFEKMKAFYAEKDWIAERIESLEGDLRAIARMSPLAAVNYIRQGMGYDEYLIEYAAFRRMRPEELLETADELKESAAGFKTFDEWFAHIEAYKEELLRQAAQRRTETDAITLATMHSAKGLEFPIVYILDANEGITPHSRAMLDEDMEEERRLFYVAMTRAKTRLHVYAVRERYHKKAEVSRFVWEYLGRES